MGKIESTFKEKLLQFRHNLGLVFDDNLDTSKWYNIADWVIVFMILLSAVEIFLSTLSWDSEFEHVLTIINNITLWFFVVEVSLRIWAAPEQNPKFKGLKGRIKYCFTFYGFIDFISTYPFLIQFLLPMSVDALRIMRVARIIRVLRITRYASSFNLLSDTIREKKNELIVSLQFLIIATFILSIMLFIYEHDAQPEVYDNGFKSVVWTFAQYIGEAGQFVDTPPVTTPGKIIAFLIGVISIAIVAVPAGILGAGFTEAIENRNKRQTIEANSEKIRNAFQRKLDIPTGFQVVRPFLTLITLQTRLDLTMDEIVEAANSGHAPHFRLVNIASSIPAGQYSYEAIAVEHFCVNRPYGCFIDRSSNITIVSPLSYVDMGIGNWSFYLAAIGGFNYISRELGDRAAINSHYYQKNRCGDPGMDEFTSDLQRLLDRSNAWSLTTLAASDALEMEHTSHMLLQTYGKKDRSAKGDETRTFDEFYQAMSERLRKDFDIITDRQEHRDSSYFQNYLNNACLANNINVNMCIEWKRILWSPQRLQLALAIAEEIWLTINKREMPEPPAILKTKQIGFDGYEITNLQ